MNEDWTQEKVRQFNEKEPTEYANVVALAGGKVQQPEPEGVAAMRIIAHQSERIDALEDFGLRATQTLRDVVDASHESRPDLEAFLAEGDRLLAIGGEV